MLWNILFCKQIIKSNTPNCMNFPAGMIVPEELEVHKETEKSRGQQESMEAATQPQDSTVTVEDAAEVTEKEPNTASEIKTEVTTEDMSVEQNADDNNGKSEGWSAELEQPKISTAVETEVEISPSLFETIFRQTLPITFWVIVIHASLLQAIEHEQL